MSQVWIVGSTGQLGAYLCERLGARGIGISRGELDLADTQNIQKYLDAKLAKTNSQTRPEVLINSSAYNLVDKAESESKLCLDLNVEVPSALARWCLANGVRFVHYSTDFVYSGEGDQPWATTDQPAPLNFYGNSKLLGERAVLEAMPSAVVFRTSWVYSHRRSNFLLAILNRVRDKGELFVVGDQIGHPTYADDLAKMTLDVISTPDFIEGTVGGVYNLSSSGFVSRYDFASEILKVASEFEPGLTGVKLISSKTSDFPSVVKRPLNTRLDLSGFESTFHIQPRNWKLGLRDCLRKYYESR